MTKSALQIARAAYQPKLPKALQGPVKAKEGAATQNIGDLSGWDTGNVTTMAAMFYNAGRSKATSWGIGNIGSWSTSNVTNMGTMFKGAGYNATTWNIGDISSWDVTAVTSHSDFIDLNTNQTNASVVNNQPHWN